MWSVIFVIASYLAGLNVPLSMYAGTCTMGDADRLFGILLSIVLFSVALLALAKSRCRILVLWLTSPVALVLIWQLVFSLGFLLAVFRGESACDFLTGEAGYPAAGFETPMAALWLAVAVAVPAVLSILLVRSLRAPRPRPDRERDTQAR